MAVSIAVGVSDEVDPVAAFSEAADAAARGLGGSCDLALVFAGAPHIGHAKPILSEVHGRLEPASLIGCGAGGVVGGGREIEGGPGAVVWALSAPGAGIVTHHFQAEPSEDGVALSGLPDRERLGEALIVLADPYTFSAEALLGDLNESRPGLPVLGGLASAAAGRLRGAVSRRGRAPLRRRRLLADRRPVDSLRLAGGDPGRSGDDDHSGRRQPDQRARLEACDRAPARGDRRSRPGRAAARGPGPDARSGDRREPARVRARRFPRPADHRRRPRCRVARDRRAGPGRADGPHARPRWRER